MNSNNPKTFCLIFGKTILVRKGDYTAKWNFCRFEIGERFHHLTRSVYSYITDGLATTHP